MLWNKDEIIKATGGDCEKNNWQASCICLDSRKIKKGDIFIALKTEKSDGHKYIETAISKGAVAVIVSKKSNLDIPQILVKDTMQALTDIGIYARNKLQGKIIGITGSVGKTTTKDMLKNTLSTYGETYATSGNLNNHLGVPLTLAHAPLDAKFIIIEMGMSSLLEIDALTKIAKPDIAVVVSVENNHIEFFDGINQIAQAKSEIFNGLNKNGIAIYNNSTNCTEIILENAQQNTNNIVSYGKNNIKDIEIINNHQTVSLDISGKEIKVKINGLGSHRILNTLAVLNVISELGLNLSNAVKKIQDTKPTVGRGSSEKVKIKDGEITLFDESYNASPASMRSALEVLSLTKTKGRRIAVLGDMLELGKDSSNLHKELIDDINKNNIDIIFACGKYMHELYKLCPPDICGAWENNSSILSKQVLKLLRDGDTIMVKGSLGSNMKIIIEKIKEQ